MKGKFMKRSRIIALTTVLAIAAIGAGAYALISTPAKAGVAWSDSDYGSYLSKVGSSEKDKSEFNLSALAEGKFKCTGSKDVDRTFTSAEIGACLSNANNASGPVKDVSVRFLGGNEAEATFRLSESAESYILEKAGGQFVTIVNAVENKPIYLKARIEKNTDKSISAKILDAKVGRIPIPEGLSAELEKALVSGINGILGKYDGLSIREISIGKDTLSFKGTVPASVTPVK